MGKRNQTETTSEHGASGPGRHPVLIVVGSAERLVPELADPVLRVGPTLSIGRDARGSAPEDGASWRPADRLVSLEHARLVRGPRGVELEDLGSTNGTFVNGRRIQSRAPLTSGDIVFAGGHAAVFRVTTPQELEAIREEQERPFGPVATSAPAMALVCQKLRRLAPSQSEILLTGETGAGKEVYAEAIHRASARPGPFVAINCAALPRELVESELFGYVRGAHSQAVAPKKGLLHDAAGGTIFLDEIGEMPGDAQAKLLRFLQTKAFTPLGSTTPIRTDVRIIAATNRASGAGDIFGLRPDLAARLGAQPLRLPALRNRIEDLGRLAAFLLGKARGVSIKTAAFRALCLHRWPGNVRELEKVVSEALLLSAGDRIGTDHLPETIGRRGAEAAATPPPQRARRREAPTRAVLEDLLARHEGNVAEVARSLDRQWAVVWRCIVREGIEVEKFRKLER